eukprot:789029_1
MPSSWKSIFCQLHVECPQLQNKNVSSTTYYRPTGNGCTISSFEDLLSSCYNRQLTFTITIRIIRITLNANNRILFQIKPKDHETNRPLQWKIDEETMIQLKSFKRGKGISSDIYNNNWCLQLYPNGQWCSPLRGYVRIGLQLCGLPPNVSKMSVQWTVYCHEAKIKDTLTYDFDQHHDSWTWKANMISFAEFSLYSTWTVSVKINILKEFDLNGNAIKEPQNEALIPNLKYETHAWRVVDPSLLPHILSAKNGDCVRDPTNTVFEIAKLHNLNWTILLFPNGRNEMCKGCCCVILKLLGMPSSWKSIFCQVFIACPQTQNKMVFSLSFGKLNHMLHECYISSFKGLKAPCGKQLTFVVTIRIARITLKACPGIPLSEEKANNKILFQMKTKRYKKNMRLRWKIDKEMIKKMKSFQRPEGMCSVIYGIWCLQIYPNGNAYSKAGDVIIALRLCGIPPNVSKMSVQWTVQCHEANIKQTFTNDFNEEY